MPTLGISLFFTNSNVSFKVKRQNNNVTVTSSSDQFTIMTKIRLTNYYK